MEAWLRKAGAAGLENLEIADFDIGGRGLRALRPYKDGDKIISIPGTALWTVEHAHADPLLGPALRSLDPPLSVDDILATYLLFVRARETGYEGMRCHVAALPTSYSSSIFFSDDELEVCAGTSLYVVTKQLEEQIRGDHRSLVTRLFIQYPDLFPLETSTIEDYKWALCTVWSRAMDFKMADGTSIRLLAPFADMLNHSHEAKQCHVYDPSSGDVSILAGKDYEIADQVCINYGALPNNRLLRLYGFVIPGNPHDSYDLVLSTHPDAPLFEQKQKLWTLAGLDSVSTITITRLDPLPSSVLQYLRIQQLDASDLREIVQKQITAAHEKVSHSNEIQVLRFLVDSLAHHLQTFPIQVKELEAWLASGVYLIGGNAWAAAHASIGEQQILISAKQRAEVLLATEENQSHSPNSSSGATSVMSQCANCGKTAGRLMLCARCKAVKYCERACQVAHHKEHKDMCRALSYNNATTTI